MIIRYIEFLLLSLTLCLWGDAVTPNPDRPKYHPDCMCTKDHTGQICKTAGFDIPPSYQAVTAEYIQDISGEVEEQFYLSTQAMYRLHR